MNDYTYLCYCDECGIELPRYELCWSHDYHGYPFRLLCGDCWDAAMAKGYDGEYYSGEWEDNVQPREEQDDE